MPEGVGYGSQYTASVGKSLNYVGQDTYAHSGITDATDSATPLTLLKYTTGAKTQRQVFQFFDVDIGSHQRVVQIKLNGTIVIQSNYDGTDPSFHNEQYHIVVPPFTEVEFLGNINGSVVGMFVSMRGRLSK